MKRGFTLIELLAVIVILAIIALIATPIIVGIINDARKDANERSIELYANAVRNAIATYQLKEEDEPTKFSEIEKYLEYDGNVVCDTVQINGDGTVGLANCKVNDEEVDYKYGNLSTCIIERQNSNKYTIGDVVTCNLTESIDKFYVIENASIDTKTIKMLPEKNIHVTEFRQSDNAGITEVDILSNYDKYGNSVFENLHLSISGEYVTYLNKSNLGSSAKLIDDSELHTLGCTTSNCLMGYICGGVSYADCDAGNTGNAPSWVYTPAYMSGIAGNIMNSYFSVNSGFMDYVDRGGVRPVITINTSEIG